MYCIVSEICTGGRFSEDCFYCYSQQIISAVTNESLIPYKKEHQKDRNSNTVTLNANPNQMKTRSTTVVDPRHLKVK